MEIVNSQPVLQRVMNSLVDGTFGEKGLFQDVYNSLLMGSHPDVYFLIKDFKSYCQAQERIAGVYKDPLVWQQKALINIASSGKFSSDRTILEYAEEIWGISPIQ